MHRIRLTHRSLGRIDLADWSGIVLGGGPYNVSDAPDSKSATQQRVESELLPLIDRIVDRRLSRSSDAATAWARSVRSSAPPSTAPTTEPVGAMTITVTGGRSRRSALRRGARGLRRVRRTQGGGDGVAHRSGLSGVLAGLPGAGLPRPRERLRHAVSPRTRRSTASDTRIDVYKNHGYFAPESAEALKTEARQWNVRYPPTILRRFIERYARRSRLPGLRDA